MKIRFTPALPCSKCGNPTSAGDVLLVATIGHYELIPRCGSCDAAVTRSERILTVDPIEEPSGSGDPEGGEGAPSTFLYHINPEG